MQDDQNQNSVETQPQSASGIQTQTATVPVTEANSNVQGQGGSSLLFGNNSNTGSLLNQSQVVGTGQVVAKEEPVTNPQSSKGVLIFDILIAVAVVLALAWVFRVMAKVAERRS